MVSAIADFGRIARFDERETRRSFWPFAIVVVVLYFITSVAIAMPFTLHVMGATMQAAQANPELLKDQAAMRAFSVGVAAEAYTHYPWLKWASVAVRLGLIVLLAAAVSRRLHDTGMRAWWGALPVPFMLLQMAISIEMPNAGLMTLAQLSSIGFWLAVVALILLLARGSSPDDNRFGAAPRP